MSHEDMKEALKTADKGGRTRETPTHVVDNVFDIKCFPCPMKFMEYML